MGEEPAYCGVKYGDEPEFKKWNVGDLCYAELNGLYREFTIRNLVTNNNSTRAYLIAVEKLHGERITPRTIRDTTTLTPSPRSPQKGKSVGYVILQALTLIIPLASLSLLLYVILKPSVLDEDK